MAKGYRLLLIDDEDEFRFLIKTDLENEGFEVLEAVDGLSGIERAVKEQPDLILLDLNMPDPDGHQVYEMIRKEPAICETPVIILTTGDDVTDRNRQIVGGADDYIGKAVDPKERVDRIRAVLLKRK